MINSRRESGLYVAEIELPRGVRRFMPAFGSAFQPAFASAGGGTVAFNPILVETQGLYDITWGLHTTPGDATNLLIYTENLRGWNSVRCTVAYEQIMSPDNWPLVGLITPQADVTSQVNQVVSGVTPSMTKCFSIYAMQGPGHNGTSHMTLRVSDGTNTFTTSVVPAATMTRYNVVVPDTNTGITLTCYVNPDADLGTQSIYFWGARLAYEAMPGTYVANGSVVGQPRCLQWLDWRSKSNPLAGTPRHYNVIIVSGNECTYEAGAFVPGYSGVKTVNTTEMRLTENFPAVPSSVTVLLVPKVEAFGTNGGFGAWGANGAWEIIPQFSANQFFANVITTGGAAVQLSSTRTLDLSVPHVVIMDFINNGNCSFMIDGVQETPLAGPIWDSVIDQYKIFSTRNVGGTTALLAAEEWIFRTLTATEKLQFTDYFGKELVPNWAISNTPAFASAEIGAVNTTTLVLTLSRAVNSATADYKTGFTITKNGIVQTITSATLEAGNHAKIDFVVPASNGTDVWTIAYDATTGNLRDELFQAFTGYAMATFTAQSVTNNVLIPTALAGLTLLNWLSADSGAYKDLGVTPCANTDTVEQWNDRQHNPAHNAKQTTAGSRPQYLTNIKNGLPVVRFSAKLMDTDTINHNIGTGGFYYACVYCPRGTASDAGVAQNSASHTPGFVVSSNTGVQEAGIYDAGRKYFTDLTFVVGTFYIVEWWRDSSGVVHCAVNGTESATTYNRAGISYPNAIFEIGNGLTGMNGDIGESVFYQGAPTTQNRTDLRVSWLNARWAVY